MSNKHSKILSIVIVVLFVFQCIPVNALSGIPGALSGIGTGSEISSTPNPSGTEMDKNMSLDEKIEQARRLYNQSKIQLEQNKINNATYPQCETDKSVKGVRVEDSPADKALYITGRSVHGEGSLVSIAIKDNSNNILYTTSCSAGDSGMFKIDIPKKLVKSNDYKVNVKSRKKTFNEDSVFIDMSETEPAAESSLLLSNAFSSVDGTLQTDSLMETEAMDYGTVDGLSISNACFADSNNYPSSGNLLTSLVSNSTVYFDVKITNNTGYTKICTRYLRLYNKAGDLCNEVSASAFILNGSSTTYAVSMVLPSIDLTGYYLTGEVFDNSDELTISNTYRFPLNLPTNLNGKITFSMDGSLQVGDKVVLSWDEVPGAEKYKIFRNGVEYAEVYTNRYNGDYSGGNAPLSQNDQIYTFTVKAFSGENYTESEPIKAARGDIYINSATSLECNYILEKIHLQPGTSDYSFDLNGKVIKTYGVFEVGSGSGDTKSVTLNMNGGRIFVLNSGDFKILGKSKLQMTNDADYLYVEGSFELFTTQTHNATNMNKGMIEVKKDFKKVYSTVFQLEDVNSTHTVALTGKNIQTVDFGTDTTGKFNILMLNKPFNGGYVFCNKRNEPQPEIWQNWCRVLNYCNAGAERYYGIDGVYPATGGFSRTYTDMSLDAPGFDINISRTYNSNSVSNEPRRGWTMGKGWSFSYEGSVEDEEPPPSASSSPTPTPTPTSSPTSSPSPKMKTVYLPGGGTLKFSYIPGTTSYTAEDSRAELTKSLNVYTLTMKDKTQYQFTEGNNSNAWLTCIKDMYGNKTDIIVDNNGRVNKIKDQTGRCFKVVYDTKNHITMVKDFPTETDADNDTDCIRKVEYSYDSAGLLSEVRDTLVLSSNSYRGNLTYKYQYNSLDYLTTVKDGYDQCIDTVEYVMDSSGKVTKTVDAFGKESAYDYDTAGKRTTLTEKDLEGITRTTTYDYDDSLAITTTTYPDNKTNIVQYEKYNGDKNKYNEIKYITDRNGNKTEYVRDSSTGNILEIRNPDYITPNPSATPTPNSVKMYGYYTDSNKENLLKWEKDEEGNYVYYVYDESRQLTNKCVYRKKIPDPAVTPVYSTGEASKYIVTTYEYFTQLECQARGYAGGLLKAEIRTCNTGSSLKTVRQEYEYGSNSSTYDYSNLIRITDKMDIGNDKKTEFEYDSIRKQKFIKKPYAVDAGQNTIYSVVFDKYDMNGRLEKSDLYSSDDTSDAKTTRYVYDIMGRLVQKITPNLYYSSNEDLDNHDYTDKNTGYRYTYYRSTDKLSKVTDAENNETNYYKYDVYGNLLIEQKPANNPTDSSDPEATVFCYEYDNMDRQTKRSHAADYDINTDGSITINLKETLEEYDYTQPNEAGHGSSYLEVRKQTRYFDASTSTETKYKYDYAGRLYQTVYESDTADPETVTNEYYLNGKISAVQDMMGYKTYYTYGYENEDSVNPAGKYIEHIWTPSDSQFDDVNNRYNTAYYTYKRIVYDDSGNEISENIKNSKVASDPVNSYQPFGRETVEGEQTDSGYSCSTYTYYADCRIFEAVDYNYSRKKYYYDDSGNMNKLEEFGTSSTTPGIVTEYVCNFMGKPDKKKIHVRKGDIYDIAYNYNNNDDLILEYNYDYDADGNNTVIYEPQSYSQPFSFSTFYYNNLDMQYAKGRGTNGGVNVSPSTLNWEGKPVMTQDYGGRQTFYKYNWNGLAVEIKKNVKVWENGSDVQQDCIAQYDYDRAGRKTTEVMPKYYSAGGAATAANRTEYTYDNFGRVKTKRLYGPEKEVNTTTWLFNDVTPPGGYITAKSYDYDKNGNMIKETDGDGYFVEYGYTPQGKMERKLDQVSKEKSLPFTVKYSYDTLGRTSSGTYVKNEGENLTEGLAKGIEIDYSYSVYPSTSQIDGMKTEKSIKCYDGYTGITDNSILETSYYNLTGNMVKFEQYRDGSTVNTTIFTYNSMNKLSQKIVNYTNLNDSLDNIENKVAHIINRYDALGNLKYVQNDMATISDTSDDICESYSYNYWGYNIDYARSKFDGTKSVTIRKEYDLNGNLTGESDGRDNYTYYTYDEMNRVKTKRITVNGVVHETQNGYDKDGNLIRKADVTGNYTFNEFKYDYDGKDRLVEKFDVSSSPQDPVSLEKIEYNSRSLQDKSYKVYESDLTGTTTYVLTSYSYDKNGRLTDTVEDPAGLNHKTSVGYDNHGNVNAKYDGNNRKTAYRYDCLDRLREVQNPKGESTKYEYDYAGNMTKQEKKYSTLYEYNSLNKVIRKIDNGGRTGIPGSYTYIDGRYEAYNYYSDGNAKRKRDRNGTVVQYTYRPQGWLEKQEPVGTGGITLTYDYDNSGNALTVTMQDSIKNEKEETARQYDELNRVTVKSLKKDTDTTPYTTLNYTYDIITTDGLLAERQSYTNNSTNYMTSKIYDKAGRLKNVVDGDVTGTDTTLYEYYKDGSRKRVTYPGGAKEEYTYTKDNLLRTLVNTKADASEMDRILYYYDAAHNQTMKIEQKINGQLKGVTSYFYDEVNRLKGVKESGISSKSTMFTYDEEGNRKTESVLTGSTPGVKVYNYTDRNRVSTIDSYDNSRITYLSNINWIASPPPVNGSGSIQKDASNLGNTITINGVEYDKGLGVHGASEVRYDLTGGSYQWFICDIGVDDEVKDDPNNNAEVRFKVYLDDQTTPEYDSGVMTGSSAAKSITVDVAGHTTLKLVVSSEGTVTTDDHGDWADAKLLKAPASTVTYYYDSQTTGDGKNGNVTKETRDTYTYEHTYNMLNQLSTTVVKQGATTISTVNNTYNGEGYRVKQSITKSGATTYTRYVYEYDKVIAELDSSGVQTARNIYGTNLLKRTVGGLSYYYMYNGHGDVTALIDASAAENIAQNKTITGSVPVTNAAYATDGTVNTSQCATVGSNLQWAELDFGQSENIDRVKLWHYFGDSRTYRDVIIQLSNDSTFATGVTTVYNNDTNNSAGQGTGTDTEYSESSQGKEIKFAPVNARYIRLWSNGSSVNQYNHIVELEVYKCKVAATYYYDAFGNLTGSTGSVSNSITYAGYQYDKETGLYYLNARMYDPVTARFLQEDTYTGDTSDPLSLNLYTYCLNEPIMYIDPTGYDAVPIRTITADYGGKVSWDAKTKTAVVTIKGNKYSFNGNIINGTMYVDDDDFLYTTGLSTPGSTQARGEARAKTSQITASSLGVFKPYDNYILNSTSVSDSAKAAIRGSTTVSSSSYVIKPLVAVGGTVFTTNEYDYILRIPKDKYPETAKHIEDAISKGQPDKLTINRPGAKANRTASLKGIKALTGADRDEYPMAMFKEGGANADVKHIEPSDNRGCGSYVSHKLRQLPDGTVVKVEVVDSVDDDDDDINNSSGGGSSGGNSEIKAIESSVPKGDITYIKPLNEYETLVQVFDEDYNLYEYIYEINYYENGSSGILFNAKNNNGIYKPIGPVNLPFGGVPKLQGGSSTSRVYSGEFFGRFAPAY